MYLYEKEIIGIVREYVDKEIISNDSFAIMIDGEWGCGKTYFVENMLIPELTKIKKEVIKISLNGIADIKPIEDLVVYEVNKIENPEKADLINAVKKGTDTIMECVSTLVPDTNTKKILKSIPLGDIITKLSIPEDYIIILDDFERCKVDYCILFGLIDKLLNKNHCIIIGNEEELLKKLKDTAVEYKTIKEKIISNTYYYSANINQVYFAVIENFDNELKQMLSENAKDIIELFEKMKCKNIRTIKFSLNEFKKFYEKIELSNFDKTILKEYLEEILFYIVYSSIIYKSGIKDSVKYDGEEDTYLSFSLNNKDRYIHAFMIVDECINKGYYDKKKINNSAVNYLKKQINNNYLEDDPMIILKEWWENPNSIIEDSLNKIMDRINKGYYKDQFFDILKLVIKLKEQGFNKRLIDKTILIMQKNITKDLKYLYIDDISDKYFEKEFMEEYMRIKEKFIDLIKEKEIKECITMLNSTLKDENWSTNLSRFYFKKIDVFEKKGFLCCVDVEMLLKNLNEATIKEVSNLRRSFHEVYFKSSVKEYFFNDLENIKILKEYLENKSYSKDVSMNYNIRMFVKDLDEIVKKIN